jgi:branched-chain amino acid transport system ATP-binding protein
VAALKDVSFEVAEGRISGFIGPNGAGKTTLFSVITGAQKPSGGEVRLRGKDVTGMRPSSLVKMGVARTHQIVRPFRAMTVLENVQLAVHYGRKGIRTTGPAREAAMETLQQVGLEHRAGYPAAMLSLGEQKRLEVARAICCCWMRSAAG